MSDWSDFTARCPACRKTVPVAKTGIYAAHRDVVRGETCRGSHEPYEDPVEVELERRRVRREADRRDKQCDPGAVVTLRHIEGPGLEKTEFPELPALLVKQQTVIIRLKRILQVVGYRGYGKSWVLMTLALLMQAGRGLQAMGFSAPASRRVLYVDGEMSAQDVRARFLLLSKALKLPITDKLRIIASDWQDEPMARLDTPGGQAAIAADADWAEVVFLDNRSCLFDSEAEKDPAVWQNAADWLLSLRRAGKAVVMGHHANRALTSRGISKPEDIIDLELTLKLPEDYKREEGCRFVAEWTKVRASWGPGFEAFAAALKDGVWQVEPAERAEGSAVERKVLAFVSTKNEIDEPVTGSNAVFAGIRGSRPAVLAAVKRLLADGRLVDDDGLRVKKPAA
jgi:hypothetical protein